MECWRWQSRSQVGMEPEDRYGLLRRERQGRQPGQSDYQRSQLSGQSDAVKKEIDQEFANDQYWLLLPLHVVWDGAAVTDDGMQKLPLGDGSAKRVVVKYPSEGGYQPGDTWELYVGSDYRVEELVYRRGGPKKPSVVIATWAGYKKAGPLFISTDHR